ncbi:transposase-like protein [Colletotrichum kahawae]|uniref:Transposase-like protein n=1 Tax=Colletotrichum kahawae TaxID=34407 RepID=A0AAD9Y581_COLKA|nr:transposase-like protein [Colletotrichum kahawae]
MPLPNVSQRLDRFVGLAPSSVPRGIAAQLRAASTASNASSTDLYARNSLRILPHATWRGRTFVNAELISKKGSRGRTSWIRDEGFFVCELLPDDELGMAPTMLALFHTNDLRR